jgi:anthraniloyl-CoA monooxygenase
VKVVVVGGGPAGLYFALLMKKSNVAHDVIVIERNSADDTFGWGVVFSDQTMENFRQADPETYQAITDHFAHWDDIDVHVRGVTITSGGHGFSGIARRTLLKISPAVRSTSASTFASARSSPPTRTPPHWGSTTTTSSSPRTCEQWHQKAACPAFPSEIDVRHAKYIWLGRRGASTRSHSPSSRTSASLPGTRLSIRRNQSAFIVECDERSWRRGFDRMNMDESIATCEQLFAPWLTASAATNMRHCGDRSGSTSDRAQRGVALRQRGAHR